MKCKDKILKEEMILLQLLKIKIMVVEFTEC